MPLTDYYSIPGVRAGAAITQYRAVKLTTADRKVVIATGITDKIIGICQDDPAADNDPADIACFGVAKWQYGGTITRGDLLGTDASGKADSIAAGTDTTVYVVGIALESGVLDDIRQVLMLPFGRAA